MMPSSPTLVLFLAAALALLIVPGPAVLNIVACSLTRGRRAGIACVLGTEAATLIHTTAAALGLSALLMSSALAFSTVKYLGAAYLVYLGLRALLAREQRSTAPRMDHAPLGFPRLFAQGFLVNLLNPKTALFFLAFLPQFADPSKGPLAGQIFALGLLFAALATCTDGAYALLVGTAGRWLKGKTAVRYSRRYVTGTVYIGLGIAAALSGADRK
jgi:threonine/homoserine/homoserine lactone efflux protein